mgnify:CR=1 FL=1
MSRLTMGSLFDGIGGFPLAAIRSGITPVWASEIEAFPIEVTKLRFPDMVHVGDITKLHGAELPPVDIICGGSPCQDLSVAGARAGLGGASFRSFYGADAHRARNAVGRESPWSGELQHTAALDVLGECAGCFFKRDTEVRGFSDRAGGDRADLLSQ